MEHGFEMLLGVVSGKQYGFLANEPAEAVGDEEQRPRGGIGQVSVPRQQRFWPRFGLAMSSPGAVPIARQPVNKADIDEGVTAVTQNFYTIRKGRVCFAAWALIVDDGILRFMV
ncbi:hypothetical protein MAJ_08221, partial [Metarhizium majus ARSEF 297]